MSEALFNCVRCTNPINTMDAIFLRDDNALLHLSCVQKSDKPWKVDVKAHALRNIIRDITAITNALCSDHKRRRVFVLEDLRNGYVQGYIRRRQGTKYVNVYGMAMPYGKDDWQFVANSDVQTRIDDEGTMHIYRETDVCGFCATIKTLLDTSMVDFYAHDDPHAIFTRIFADDISVFPNHRERAIQFASLYVQG